jgi:hypothetical protein
MEHRCSSCGASGGIGFMTKSQSKKPAEKQRCISCVDNNNAHTTPPLPTSNLDHAHVERHISLPKLQSVVSKLLGGSCASPLQKSLLLCKTNSPKSKDNDTKKRKLELPDSQLPIAIADVNHKVLKTAQDSSEVGSTNDDKLRAPVARDYLSVLVKFYKKYNPARSENREMMQKMLEKHAGNEDTLFKKLLHKYKKKQSVDNNEEDKRETTQNQSSRPNQSSVKSGSNLKCDKCDGNHATDACPHFKKSRDNHPDAQKRKAGADIGGSGGNVFVTMARVVSQPGDGSCLFHSMAFGLNRLGVKVGNARTLRRDIADFLMKNPNTKISDTPVSSWVKWDSGMNLQKYCGRMAHGGWGGGIELAGWFTPSYTTQIKSLALSFYHISPFTWHSSFFFSFSQLIM